MSWQRHGGGAGAGLDDDDDEQLIYSGASREGDGHSSDTRRSQSRCNDSEDEEKEEAQPDAGRTHGTNADDDDGDNDSDSMSIDSPVTPASSVEVDSPPSSTRSAHLHHGRATENDRPQQKRRKLLRDNSFSSDDEELDNNPTTTTTTTSAVAAAAPARVTSPSPRPQPRHAITAARRIAEDEEVRMLSGHEQEPVHVIPATTNHPSATAATPMAASQLPISQGDAPVGPASPAASSPPSLSPSPTAQEGVFPVVLQQASQSQVGASYLQTQVALDEWPQPSDVAMWSADGAPIHDPLCVSVTLQTALASAGTVLRNESDQYYPGSVDISQAKAVVYIISALFLMPFVGVAESYQRILTVFNLSNISLDAVGTRLASAASLLEMLHGLVSGHLEPVLGHCQNHNFTAQTPEDRLSQKLHQLFLRAFHAAKAMYTTADALFMGQCMSNADMMADGNIRVEPVMFGLGLRQTDMVAIVIRFCVDTCVRNLLRRGAHEDDQWLYVSSKIVDQDGIERRTGKMVRLEHDGKPVTFIDAVKLFARRIGDCRRRLWNVFEVLDVHGRVQKLHVEIVVDENMAALVHELLIRTRARKVKAGVVVEGGQGNINNDQLLVNQFIADNPPVHIGEYHLETGRTIWNSYIDRMPNEILHLYVPRLPKRDKKCTTVLCFREGKWRMSLSGTVDNPELLNEWITHDDPRAADIDADHVPQLADGRPISCPAEAIMDFEGDPMDAPEVACFREYFDMQGWTRETQRCTAALLVLLTFFYPLTMLKSALFFWGVSNAGKSELLKMWATMAVKPLEVKLPTEPNWPLSVLANEHTLRVSEESSPRTNITPGDWFTSIDGGKFSVFLRQKGQVAVESIAAYFIAGNNPLDVLVDPNTLTACARRSIIFRLPSEIPSNLEKLNTMKASVGALFVVGMRVLRDMPDCIFRSPLDPRQRLITNQMRQWQLKMVQEHSPLLRILCDPHQFVQDMEVEVPLFVLSSRLRKALAQTRFAWVKVTPDLIADALKYIPGTKMEERERLEYQGKVYNKAHVVFGIRPCTKTELQMTDDSEEGESVEESAGKGGSSGHASKSNGSSSDNSNTSLTMEEEQLLKFFAAGLEFSPYALLRPFSGSVPGVRTEVHSKDKGLQQAIDQYCTMVLDVEPPPQLDAVVRKDVFWRRVRELYKGKVKVMACEERGPEPFYELRGVRLLSEQAGWACAFFMSIADKGQPTPVLRYGHTTAPGRVKLVPWIQVLRAFYAWMMAYAPGNAHRVLDHELDAHLIATIDHDEMMVGFTQAATELGLPYLPVTRKLTDSNYDDGEHIGFPEVEDKHRDDDSASNVDADPLGPWRSIGLKHVEWRPLGDANHASMSSTATTSVAVDLGRFMRR